MRRRRTVALMVVVPLGFATKWYVGPGAGFVGNYLGGVLYEVFWVLVVLLVWPLLPAARVAVGVFLATCLLEALQLWHPPVLEAIRGTFLGRTLIGTTFSWWDFPCYAAGCCLALALEKAR